MQKTSVLTLIDVSRYISSSIIKTVFLYACTVTRKFDIPNCTFSAFHNNLPSLQRNSVDFQTRTKQEYKTKVLTVQLDVTIARVST